MKYELNHDALAKQVFDKASADMKLRRKAEQLVRNNYELYLKRQALMTAEQLEEIRPFRQALNLMPEEHLFIEKSINVLRATKRRWLFYRLLAFATLLLFSGFSAWQWRETAYQQRVAESGRLALLAQQEYQRLNFNDAFNLAQESLLRNPNNSNAKDIISQIVHRSAYHNLTPLSISTLSLGQSVQKVGLGVKKNAENFDEKEDTILIAALTSERKAHIFKGKNDIKNIGEIEDCNPDFSPIFSPNGSHILTLSQDSLLIINDLNNFNSKSPSILRGHTDYVRGAFFLNSDSIISWGNDGKVKLWDKKGTLLKTIGEHAGFVESVVPSPDGQLLFSRSDNGEAQVSHIKNDSLSTAILGAKNIQAAAFWNLDTLLLFDSVGIKTWSFSKKDWVAKPLFFNRNDINTPIFSASTDVILFLKKDNKYATLGQLHRFFETRERGLSEAAMVSKIATQSNIGHFAPDLALKSRLTEPSINTKKAGFFYKNYVWTVADGSNEMVVRDGLGNPLAVLTHSTPIFGVSVLPNKLVIATFSEDGFVKIWRNNPFQTPTFYAASPNFQHKNTIKTTLSPDGKRLAINQKGAPLSVFDTKGKQIFTTFGYNAANTEGGALQVGFAKNKEIVVLNDSSRAIFFNEFGQKIQEILLSEKPKSLIFASDSNTFLVYGSRKITIWDAANRAKRGEIDAPDEILFACFTPDARHILICPRENSPSEWTFEGKKTRIFDQKGWATHAEFSPDGKNLLTSTSEGMVYIFDYKSGKPFSPFKTTKDYAQETRFFPDGKRILTLDANNFSVIHSLNEEPNATRVFGGKFGSAHFSPSGKFLLTISSEAITLWSVENEKLATLVSLGVNDSKPTYSVVFDKNDQQLWIAFDDGTVRCFLTPEGTSDLVKKYPKMGFTAVEKLRFEIK